MPKFIAIGTHPPVDPKESSGTDLATAIAQAEENSAWYVTRLDNNTFEQVYVMEGVGRLVIAEAESADALRAELTSIPRDHPERHWEINALLDFQQVVRDFVNSMADE